MGELNTPHRIVMLGRKRTYDRRRTLEVATKARSQGKRGKAVAAYREIVAQEPDDYETWGKLAPLLVKDKKLEEAWDAFKRAAHGYEHAGFRAKAMSVLVNAAESIPRATGPWFALAELHIAAKDDVEAMRVLLRGRQQMRGRRTLLQARQLLERLRVMAPEQFSLAFDLAVVLRKLGKNDDADAIIQPFLDAAKGKRVRELRRAIFWLQPSLKNAWLWLRAR